MRSLRKQLRKWGRVISVHTFTERCVCRPLMVLELLLIYDNLNIKPRILCRSSVDRSVVASTEKVWWEHCYIFP